MMKFLSCWTFGHAKRYCFTGLKSNLIGQSIRKDNEVITAILLLYFSSPTQPTNEQVNIIKYCHVGHLIKFQKYVLIQPEQGSTSIT